MPPRRSLHLLPPRLSAETVAELERLLASAKRGEVVGLAYIAICAKDYTVNAVGQADARPTLARGMVNVLDDLLRDRQKHRR